MTTDTLRVRIAARTPSGHDIVLLTLVAEDPRDALPGFSAGAHIDVHLPGDLVRQYSLCNDPADSTHYQIGVLRDPASRGGSQAIHAQLNVGTVLTIGTPRNLFPLDTSNTKAYLFGGGIGITPMVAMAHALHQCGRDFELHYSARSATHAALLEALQNAAFSDKVQLHWDVATPPHAPNPVDVAGVLGQSPAGAHIYVCGPQGYMDWVIASARSLNIPASQIHFEYFQTTVTTDGEVFQIVAKRSGKEAEVGAGETIAQVLQKLGIKVQVSCEQGICGTCLCGVLEGIPDHRDAYQTDEEKAANDQITVCCSRARSGRLVLDI